MIPNATMRNTIAPTVNAKREQLDADEAAGLVFVVGGVDRLDDVLHAARRGPQREHQAEQRRQHRRSCRRALDRLQLRFDEVAYFRWRGSKRINDLILDRVGLGHESVDGEHRHETGNEGEQGVEGDAGGEQRRVVGLGFGPRTGEDVRAIPSLADPSGFRRTDRDRRLRHQTEWSRKLLAGRRTWPTRTPAAAKAITGQQRFTYTRRDNNLR